MGRIGALPPLLPTERDDSGATDSVRVLLLLSLFLLTFLSVMASSFARFLFSPLLSCVGAGVFLSACLLDLLPDVQESFESAHLDIAFPLGEATIGCGFLIVFLLEQMSFLIRDRMSPSFSMHHGHEEEEGEAEREGEPSIPNSIPIIILVSSLSLHALFEGLSLAVVPDAYKLLQIFAALVIHKSLIGLSLGIRLRSMNIRPILQAFCAFIFSVQVLIGGLTGLYIQQMLSGQKGRVVAACLQGIACGTFLFITTMEAIPHEIPSSHIPNRLSRLSALFFGILIILMFILIFPEAA